MRLHHLHLPNPIPYTHSLRLQESLLNQHFAYNTTRLTNLRSLNPNSNPTSNPQQQTPLQPPNPTLLTFQTHPTYTVGRRHLKTNPLSPSQTKFLTSSSSNNKNLATFHASPRGGLLTYHAPGQLTGYLICDLRVHGITPRCHVRVWEDSVIATARKFGVEGGRTDDPGVWVIDTTSKEGGGRGGVIGNEKKMTDRKVCAIGVHVSRGITSHGIGFNVLDVGFDDAVAKSRYRLPSEEEVRRIRDGAYDDGSVVVNGSSKEGDNSKTEQANGYLSWGFSRIVACGLEGKSVTWLTREGADPKTKLEDVARVLAEELCVALTGKGKVGVEGVVRINEGDVLGGNDVEGNGDVEGLLGEEKKEMSDIKGGLEDWVGVLKGGKI